MDRIRHILYEAAIIVLVGVVIAGLIVAWMNFSRKPSIDDFKREYAEAHTPERQVAVAEKYIDIFPLPELLRAIEERFADVGCHIQGHAIGRVLYRRNPNFADAVKQCGGSCTYGCFHGAQMELFNTDSDTLGGVINDETPEAYAAHVRSIAEDLCTKPDVASVVRLRQCLHGLGHLFVYTAQGDLKHATDECDSLFDRSGARSCRTGAFMEKIFTSATTSPGYLTDKTPCDAYPDDAYICYRYKAYAWLYAYKSIEKTLQTCDSFGSQVLDCVSGIASAAASPELLGTNEGINSICGSLDGIKYRACEVGAFLNIINLNGGDDSEHVCDIVAPDYRADCLKVRAKFSSMIYYGAEARNLLLE